MQLSLINIAYLIASALFVIGLKRLGHPRTAVRGNRIGAVGMLIAIVVTPVDNRVLSYELILGIIATAAYLIHRCRMHQKCIATHSTSITQVKIKK